MEERAPRVLISYSHDSPEHEAAVLKLSDRLRGDGIDCTIDQYVVVPEDGWPLWMEEQIRDSDFVLMVCTETYLRRVRREEVPGIGLGVRWEANLIYNALYAEAGTNTKFIPLLFGADGMALVPAPLQGTAFYRPLTEPGYEDLLRRLTHQPKAEKPALRELPPGERRSEGAIGRLTRRVPELPPHFLARPGELAPIREAILAGTNMAVGVTGTAPVGVQGMGGIGKSVMAAALARDPEVRQAFPDGICWVAVGQSPNRLALLSALVKDLTGTTPGITTEVEGRDALRDALEEKRVLVILDDVWDAADTEQFLVSVPGAGLLLTTRNRELLVAIGAAEHSLDLLSLPDALRMLADWTGARDASALPPEASDVARECGRLPLALAMIGAMIRLRPTGWKDALARLRRADLHAIKRNFPNYPYPDLLRAIDVSVEALEPGDRERYLDLAVFPEDQPIPEEPLRVLWNLDEYAVRDCMTALVARSLATWSKRPDEGMAILLHDLQRDLIQKRREKELPLIHQRLIEGWGDFLRLPDAYAWHRGVWHLRQAGWTEELSRLLFDFDWLKAKLDATGVNALQADFELLKDDGEARLLQGAIRLSAHLLAREPDQLPGQLMGRLLGAVNPRIQTLVGNIREWRGSNWLCPLSPNLTPPGGPLIRTLEGHTDRVTGVAVTSDGSRAVSASDDDTLRVWDLESGQCLRTLEGHTNRVTGVSVTSDGARAVSASRDRTLRVWDLEIGQCLRTFEDHTRLVTGVSVTPDGSRAVSASRDRTLRVWDLESGQCLHILECHTYSVTGVAVTPDGSRAVSAFEDTTLRVWDLESGQCLHTLEGHAYSVTGVTVTSDGRRAVSASEDRTLRVWDLESGQCLRTLDGHTYSVTGVAVTSDGYRAVSASGDNTLRVWDLKSGQCLRTLDGHTREVTSVAVTSDGCRAVSASYDKALRVWDLESGQCLRTLDGHAYSVTGVTVTSDGCRAVSASYDRTLRVWDLESGQCLRTLDGHTYSVTGVAVTSDGCRAVSASYDRTLQVWDLESGQCLRTLDGHTGLVTGVTVTSDGCRAVSASEDTTLRVWDIESGQCLRTLDGHTREVTSVAVTSDGCRAVSASKDTTLRVWNLESGQCLRTLNDHTREVTGVAVTSDGCRAVSASEDTTLRVWDLESGQCLRTLDGHTYSVTGVAVTSDGYRAVSASGDNTLRVWDLESGQCLRTLEGHTDKVVGVAVTSNGCRALSASEDKTLRVWDLESGTSLAVFSGEERFLACAIAPDGGTIIAGDRFGRVHFLRLMEPNAAQIPARTLILARTHGPAR